MAKRRRRRRNPTRKMIATAVVVTVAAAAGVGAYALWRRRRRKGQYTCVMAPSGEKICGPLSSSEGAEGPVGPALPDQIAVEPVETWQERWAQQRAQAVLRCRRDEDVLSWPQAVTCALDVAFPEAAPWTDPATWAPWQHAAALNVERELHDRVASEFSTNSPTAWQAQLWITGGRLARACIDDDPAIAAVDLAQCIATSLYPQLEWPPSPDAEQWTKDFYAAARQIALNWVRPTPVMESSLSWAAAAPP